jgi:hypothetical protein
MRGQAGVQRIGISDSAVKPGALPKWITYSQFCVPLPLFRAVRQMISDLPAAAHEKDMVRSRPPNFFVALQGRPRRRAIDPSQAVGQRGGVLQRLRGALSKKRQHGMGRIAE